MDNSF